MARFVEININNDAVVSLTNKLEKLHRSALPVAIRTALNSVAFDVKKVTMPARAKAAFENRSPNFFKANSRVDMARGFNVKSMSADVGFRQMQPQANQAVDNLEEQERGGTIKGRSLIPMDDSRVGRSIKKVVRKQNRTSIMKNVVNARRAQGANKRQKFIKSVQHAGQGGLVLSEHKGKEIIWRVNSLKRTSGGRLKLTALYSYKKSRAVSVKATHFMARASKRSSMKMDEFYIIEAKKQIKRLMRK